MELSNMSIPPVFQLPVDVLALHVMGMLSLRDLVLLRTACVTPQTTWQSALALLKPLHLDSTLQAFAPAIKWILSNGVRIERMSCRASVVDSVFRIADEHADLLEGVVLMFENDRLEKQTPSQDLLQKVGGLRLHAELPPEIVQLVVSCVKNLRTLSFWAMTNTKQAEVLRVLLQNSPNLESFHLFNHQTEGLCFGRNLRELQLKVTELTGEECTRIASCCPLLKELSLHVTGVQGAHYSTFVSSPVRDELVIPFAEQCPLLTSLTLRRFRLSQCGVTAIAQRCRSLHKVDWQGGVSSAEMQLFAQYGTPIKHLELAEPLLGEVNDYLGLLGQLTSVCLLDSFLQYEDSATAVASMTSIQSFKLEDSNEMAGSNGLSIDSWFAALVLNSSAAHLLEMSLTYRKTEEPAVCNLLMHCRCLTKVELVCNYSGSPSLAEDLVAALVGLGPQLQGLSLSHYMTHDAVLLPIIRASPLLSSLRLFQQEICNDKFFITDAVVLALATHCWRGLQEVKLECGRDFTEAALLHLIGRCRKLRSIEVCRDCISTAAVLNLKKDDQNGFRLHRVTVRRF